MELVTIIYIYIYILAMGQVCSEHYGFPCQFSFHQMVHTHLSSGAGTIGHLVVDHIPSGLSLTPPHEIKRKIYVSVCMCMYCSGSLCF
jgi:hypothetical protein